MPKPLVNQWTNWVHQGTKTPICEYSRSHDLKSEGYLLTRTCVCTALKETRLDSSALYRKNSTFIKSFDLGTLTIECRRKGFEAQLKPLLISDCVLWHVWGVSVNQIAAFNCNIIFFVFFIWKHPRNADFRVGRGFKKGFKIFEMTRDHLTS